MKSTLCSFMMVGVCVLGMSGLTASPVPAAEWGDLTVTFVLDGAAPAPKPANVNKDVDFCGKHNLVDEAVVVNPENKGIANVVAWLYVERGGKKPPVHESYADAAKKEVHFDNKNCRFEPHILPVLTKQTVIIGNVDPVGHNTNIGASANPPSNVLVPAGGTLKQTFNVEERLPTPVSCNIHPWMKGYMVVKELPYVAVSDQNGQVTMKNLPAGKWTFQFWHETSGYVRDVVQSGKKTSWNRGRVELTIKPGKNELGQIKVPAELFKN